LAPGHTYTTDEILKHWTVLPDGIYFQTKKTNFGKFWKAMQWKMLVLKVPFCLLYGQMVNCLAIWYILWSFGIFFPRFGMLYREKSGNPGAGSSNKGLRF
jgi:phosphatidylglycerophosphate synthase